MPSSVVTRLNKITYASFVVGVGTDYHLTGKVETLQDYTQLTLRFFVICHDTVEATFNTECNALEAAFTTPNGDLKYEIGGSTAFDLTQSGNTGMLAQPIIRKVGSPLDSNNTRLYSVSVTVQLPADESGKSGRQSSRVVVSEDGSEIARLDVSAVYTALSSNGALAQARSAFPTYTAALQTSEGGTWDEVHPAAYASDSDDKVCQASASYRELIANQSVGTLNDTTLQGVNIRVSTRTLGPANAKGSNARALQEITVTFFARVRKSVSTNLRNVYDTKVKPHMVSVAKTLSGKSRITATLDDPGLNPDHNVIDARMKFLASSVSLISSEIVTGMVEDKPFDLVPVFTGNPFDRDRHSKPGAEFVTVFASVLELESKNDRALAPYRAAIQVFERRGYHLKKETLLSDKTSELPGIAGTSPMRLRARQMQAVLEFGKILAAGAGRRPVTGG